jgi:cephalosporin-C deacetylase-like acetyl esterase
MRCALLLALFALLAPAQTPPDSAAVRAKLTRLIGGLPESKSPLNARVTGTFAREGYRVEKIVFESLPGFRVTANLYIPAAGNPPFPAVLGVAGHSDAGKAEPTYQRAWISLVRRGYVVLAYDPPGQGERLEYFDPAAGKSRVGIGVNEHIQAGLQCLLTGKPIARYFVWDGIRAFDYLATRREVDIKRVAIAGNSGGGTQAAYVAAFEPRLAAAVSSCYMTRWQEMLNGGPGPQDAEQVIPGFLAEGLDFIDFIRAFAPRPFLITSAIQDFFPIAGARATHQESVRLYEQLGRKDNAGFFEFDDKHGWSQPRREAAYRWFDRHLKGVNSDTPEAPVDVEPVAALNVTSSGQLSTSLGSETVHSVNRELARQVHAARAAASPGADLPKLAAARIGLQTPHLVARTTRPGTKKAVVAIGISETEAERLQEQGYVIRAIAQPEFEKGRGGYTGAYQAAAREWLYGRTLLGARVAELLGAVAEVSADSQVDPKQVFLWGREHGAVAALLAALLSPNQPRVLAEDGIESWLSLTQQPMPSGYEALVVPGVLQDFDLPDLRRALATRLLTTLP